MQQCDGAAVGHLRGVARGGQLRVERHPRRARLETGEHAEDHLHTARRMNGNARFRSATRRDETGRERVRCGVQFGIRNRACFVAHGHALGMPRDAASPEREHIARLFVIRINVRHRAVGHIDERFGDTAQHGFEAPSEGIVEYGVVIGERAFDARCAIDEVQREIEVRGVVREHVQARRKRRERIERKRALLRELHLKQRIVGPRAIRQQRGDEPVVRHVLMLVRGEHRFLRRGHKRAQRRIVFDDHAQHLHVDEIADDRLRLFVPAARHRRADADIALAARLAQRRAEDRQHHHEKRRLLFARALRKACRKRGRQTEDERSLRAGRSMAALEETRDSRRIAMRAQGFAPVADLPVDLGVIDRRVLPCGKVRVLR
ncbi:hypothetical protein AWB80_08231 [Caballeronia pedi]|uniref:Uncharacterized protein n=1 Tax=Caballeronia pedi TaxID=1777141 RepID=A0A158E584_9BURK|nr:hypothetical protein AWB80_08231 [Caballeronia pedi]